MIKRQLIIIEKCSVYVSYRNIMIGIVVRSVCHIHQVTYENIGYLLLQHVIAVHLEISVN